MTISLLCGVVIAAGSSIGLARVLGGSTEIQMSLAPKSATAPVAMGISEKIGGLPSLTAVLVVITGITGAVLGTKLFEWIRVRDDTAKGIAMGVAAHGIGTARAFQVSSQMGLSQVWRWHFRRSQRLCWCPGWLICLKRGSPPDFAALYLQPKSYKKTDEMII